MKIPFAASYRTVGGALVNYCRNPLRRPPPRESSETHPQFSPKTRSDPSARLPPNPPDWSAHGRSPRPLSCGASDRTGGGERTWVEGGDGRAGGEAWVLGRPGAAGRADVLRRRLHRRHVQLARIRQLHRLLVSYYMKTTNPVDLAFWLGFSSSSLLPCSLLVGVSRGSIRFAGSGPVCASYHGSRLSASVMRGYSVFGCLCMAWMQQRSGYGAGVSGEVSNARLVAMVLGFQARLGLRSATSTRHFASNHSLTTHQSS